MPGIVDFADIVLFARAFGSRDGNEGFDITYDLTGEEKIAIDDFGNFA